MTGFDGSISIYYHPKDTNVIQVVAYYKVNIMPDDGVGAF